LLKRYYPLYEACKLGNCANLFDTWNTDGAGEMITQYCEDADADTKLSNQEVLRSLRTPPPYHGTAPCQCAMTVNYGVIRGDARSNYIAMGNARCALQCVFIATGVQT